MSNGLKKFEIELDNPTETFAPGEILLGKLIIELDRPKKLRALKLRFKGSCEVHWTEERGSGKDAHDEHFEGNEIYFRTDLCLFGSEDGDTIEMTSGLHTFPFSYNLPRNIPSTFEHSIGNVSYTIKAIFDRPWKFDHTISKIIKIEAPFDLQSTNLDPNVGIDDRSEASFCYCCCPFISQGHMELEFHVPSTFFECNDDIEASVKINNKSDSVNVTKIKMILKQDLEFHAKLPPKTKKLHYNVQSKKISGPFPKKTDVGIRLQVPVLPFSYLKHCNLININYGITISVHVSGWHCSKIKNYDIVIGSRSMPNYLVPSAPPIMPVENPVGFNLKFPLPSNNPPYPMAIFPVTSEPSYSHQQPSTNIGFIYPQPTSSHGNSNQPPPPSYESVMADTKTRSQ